MATLHDDTTIQFLPRAIPIIEDDDSLSQAGSCPKTFSPPDVSLCSSSSSSNVVIDLESATNEAADVADEEEDRHKNHHSEEEGTPALTQPNPSFFTYPCSPRGFKMQRQRFFVFLRMLLAYLEIHDPLLRVFIRKVLYDCSQRSQRQEPVTVTGLQVRLRVIVEHEHWMRAEQYTQLFLQRRRADRARCPCCNGRMDNRGRHHGHSATNPAIVAPTHHDDDFSV